ncbi:MAG TPA: alanine racemase [Bacillales bacterium]|nr:alanine racemase [Bacillales bacterium]
MGHSRGTRAVIDLDAIAANLKNFQRHLGAETEIMAVVKADGYGHGAIQVARTALEEGAAWIGVALLDEALELRRAGIDAPILVFGWTHPHDVRRAAENDIAVTVFQEGWVRDAAKILQKTERSLTIHLKLDTGMGRYGAKGEQELTRLCNEIESEPLMHLQGVYTHFATADELDSAYFDKQYRCFLSMLDVLAARGAKPDVIHCGNSAAALQYPDKAFNLVRLGISMYGLVPSEQLAPVLPFPLQEAFALKSELVHVKSLEAGEAVSYGATYVADEPQWIGTVPIGYADGWLRKISNGGFVLVEGIRAPIVGRICMDAFMVRLPKKMPIGTEVVLIGKQGEKAITVADLARQLDTITYEIPCMISERVPRFFKKN